MKYAMFFIILVAEIVVVIASLLTWIILFQNPIQGQSPQLWAWIVFIMGTMNVFTRFLELAQKDREINAQTLPMIFYKSQAPQEAKIREILGMFTRLLDVLPRTIRDSYSRMQTDMNNKFKPIAEQIKVMNENMDDLQQLLEELTIKTDEPEADEEIIG